VPLLEYRHNLKEGLLENSKLGQHAYEEGHRVIWDEIRILEIESNTRHKKYNKSAHRTCLKTPISQPRQDICSIWIPLIIDELTKSKESP
jgi:hypothetical protein